MNFLFDSFNRIEKPTLILETALGNPVGTLGLAFGIKLDLKYTDISTLSFTYPQKVDNINTLYYDDLKGNKIIEIPNIGRFKMFKPKITNDGIREIKECQAYSLEYELNQRDITQFKGTYPLYDPLLPKTSLLGIIIDNYLPSWSIGTVSPSLYGLYRTFDINKSKLYAFLNTDVAKAFEAVFTFDTFSRKINCTSIYDLNGDTGIFLSFDNLLKTVEIEELTDQVVNKLNVYGSSNSSSTMSINGVNPNGTSTIYDYSYYMTTEWVSSDLITAYNNYKILYNSLQPTYANYLTQLKNAKTSLLNFQTQLIDLQSQLSAYVDVQIARIQASQNYADVNAQIASQTVLINSKNAEISNINNTITALNNSLNSITSQLKFSNYFTASQLLELDSITNEDTYQSNDFIITSNMDSVAVQTQEQNLFDYANRMLARVSQPRFTFKIDSVNFLFLKNFQTFSGQFALGKYLTCSLREDGTYIVQPILLQVSFDYEQENSFSLIFGNHMMLDSNEFYFNDLLNQAIVGGTTLNFEKYQYNDWQTSKDSVTSFISSALDASKNAVISSVSQNILIDEHGIRCRQSLPNGSFDNKQIWVTSNNIVLSNDGFQTATIGIGLIKDDRYGSIWGIAAPLIAGRLLIGNNLRIENTANQFTLDESGCYLNNAKFTLTANNNLSKIILDPTSSSAITVQSNSTGTWNNVFYFDSLTGKLKIKGELEAGSVVSNSSISGGSIAIGNNFSVDISGNMVANNGNFTGVINATSGTLGSLSVTGTLSGGTISGTTINGSIINGAYINTYQNATVGNSLYIGNTSILENKNIIFYNGSGTSNISFQTNKILTIANGSGDLYLIAKQDIGTVQILGNILAIQNTTTNINSSTLNLNSSIINFGGATVTGLNVTAKFA